MPKYIYFIFLFVFISCQDPRIIPKKQILWTIDLPTANPLFLPTFEKDTLYFNIREEIYAINIHNGSNIWKKSIIGLLSPIYIYNDNGNLWLNPIYEDDDKSYIYKLQANNGEIISKYNIPQYCTEKTYKIRDSILLLRSYTAHELNINTGIVHNNNNLFYLDILTIQLNDSILIKGGDTTPIIFNKKNNSNIINLGLPKLIAAPTAPQVNNKSMTFDMKYQIYDININKIVDTVDFAFYLQNKLYIVKNHSLFYCNFEQRNFQKIQSFSNQIIDIITDNNYIYLLDNTYKILVLNIATNQITIKNLEKPIYSRTSNKEKSCYIHNNYVFYYSAENYGLVSLNCEKL